MANKRRGSAALLGKMNVVAAGKRSTTQKITFLSFPPSANAIQRATSLTNIGNTPQTAHVTGGISPGGILLSTFMMEGSWQNTISGCEIKTYS